MSRQLLEFDIPWHTIDGNIGGIILEVALVVWCFVGLMVVCDEYLVPALETLCRRWSVPEDVAGATFMALGSAAPELIISTVTVVQDQMNGSDALSFGVSTVIGSGMMAFTCIPGMCCFATEGEVVLKRRPLLRDIVFYFACVLVLLSVIWDGVVTMQKSVILVAIYVVYLLTVIFGKPVRKTYRKCTAGPENVAGCNLEEGLIQGASQDGAGASRSDRDKSILSEPTSESQAPAGSAPPMPTDEPRIGGIQEVWTTPTATKSEDAEDGRAGCCHGVKSALGHLAHIFNWPVHILLKITCPPAGEDEPWENFYGPAVIITFSWVGLFSFVISSIIERWVAISGVNRAIFGLLLVSTAAQVPDAVESYAVTKNGYGSMALANALGSQVINVAVGLGVPWCITCNRNEMNLQTDLDVAAVAMLVVIVATIAIFFFNGYCSGDEWKASLSRKKAKWFFLAYVVAITGWLGAMVAMGKLQDTGAEDTGAEEENP